MIYKFKDLPISNSTASCSCESKTRVEYVFISDIAKPFSIPFSDKPSNIPCGELDPMKLWKKAHGLTSMLE